MPFLIWDSLFTNLLPRAASNRDEQALSECMLDTSTQFLLGMPAANSASRTPRSAVHKDHNLLIQAKSYLASCGKVQNQRSASYPLSVGYAGKRCAQPAIRNPNGMLAMLAPLALDILAVCPFSCSC